MADTMAKQISATPIGSVVLLVPVPEVTIKIMPPKDMAAPKILATVTFSRSTNHAVKGANSGIVAIITEATVGLMRVSPYVSPMKYRNGSKRANNKNHFKSSHRGIVSLPVIFPKMSIRTEATSNRDSSSVKTENERMAILVHTYDNDQKIIAKIMAVYIVTGRHSPGAAWLVDILLLLNPVEYIFPSFVGNLWSDLFHYSCGKV